MSSYFAWGVQLSLFLLLMNVQVQPYSLSAQLQLLSHASFSYMWHGELDWSNLTSWNHVSKWIWLASCRPCSPTYLQLLCFLLAQRAGARPHFLSRQEKYFLANMADEKTNLLSTKNNDTDLTDSFSSQEGGFERVTTLLERSINIITRPWKVAVKKAYLREWLAEFFGTFLLVVRGGEKNYKW